MGSGGSWLIWLAGAYLVGSIPFGLLIGALRGVDVRKAGSGNFGATNVGRVLGRPWAVVCFILDLGKGFGPVLAYGLCNGMIGPEADSAQAVDLLRWLVVAAAAVAGHVFPVWLRFRGGKGVATTLGVVLGFYPVLSGGAAVAAVLWLAVVYLTGYVSVGSMVAAAALPIYAGISGALLGLPAAQTAIYVGLTLALAVLVIIRHHGNIARLRAGNENRVAWGRRR